MSEVHILPLEEIHTVPGFNHRRDIETERLQKSIEEVGLLQPITVAKNQDGYVLVAGERRYTACLMSDTIIEIPALIIDQTDAEKPEADRAVLAAVENMQRADLSVTEKAAAVAKIKELGYTTRRQIATKLSVPEREVKLLEQVGTLSQTARDNLHADKLAVGYVPLAAKIAAVSPEMEVKVTEEILSGRSNRSLDWLEENWPLLLVPDRFGGPAEKAEFIITNRRYDVEVLPELTDDAKSLYEEIIDLSQYEVAIEVGTDCEDAARAYGCLIEVGGVEDTSPYGVITDMTWFTDYLSARLIPDYLETLKNRALQQAEMRKTKPTIEAEAEARGIDVEKVKEERKEARDEEYAERQAADEFNVELGKQLFERCDQIKPTPEAIRLLIGLALRDSASDILLRGMRYLHPAMREDEELKNGKVRTTFLNESEEARQRMYSFFDGAKTTEELLGRFTQLWLASEFADERVVSRSQRRPRKVYAGQFAIPKCDTEFIEPSTEKLSKQLTPKMRAQAEERRDAINKDR